MSKFGRCIYMAILVACAILMAQGALASQVGSTDANAMAPGAVSPPADIAVQPSLENTGATLAGVSVTGAGTGVSSSASAAIVPGYFQHVVDLATDSHGNVYACDKTENCIQKFNSTGKFLLYWGGSGTGNGSLNNPSSIAVDRYDNVYVSDTGNYCIKKFDANGSFLKAWGHRGAENGNFTSPRGIATDSTGNVYVCDYYGDRVEVFDSNGKFLRTLSGGPGSDSRLKYPMYIAIDGKDRVYVLDESEDMGDISSLDIKEFYKNGSFIKSYARDVSYFWHFIMPEGIAADSVGNVYVADTIHDNVVRFDQNGSLLNVWGAYPGDTVFHDPAGIAVDRSGNIYVDDSGDYTIQKLDRSGKFLAVWGNYKAPGKLSCPADVALDKSGNLYVTDKGTGKVSVFNKSGSFKASWGGPGFRNGYFYYPVSTCFSPDNSLYVMDPGAGKIQKFALNGSFIRSIKIPAQNNSFTEWQHNLAVCPDGSLVAGLMNDHVVEKLAPNGTVLAKWGGKGSSNGKFETITSVAADSHGNIYVADYNVTSLYPDMTFTSRVQKFDSKGNFLSIFIGTGTGYDYLGNDVYIAFDASDNLYVSDRYDSVVQKYNAQGQYMYEWGALSNSYSLTVGPDGNIYLASWNCVAEYSPYGSLIRSFGN